jgi:hypothetical protein
LAHSQKAAWVCRSACAVGVLKGIVLFQLEEPMRNALGVLDCYHISRTGYRSSPPRPAEVVYPKTALMWISG